MTDYNESEKEKELNELFEGNSNKHSFQRIVKKAKRKTILRNIVISSLVMIFLFITLGFSWLSIMRWSQENAMRDLEIFSRITSPNVEYLGYQNQGNSLFEGILYYKRYKKIGGIPIDWSEKVVTYSIFGGVNRFTGDHAPIQLIDENDGHSRYYDRETKQRIMEFYHPEVTYDYLRNDLRTLTNFSDEMLVEIALSFDQPITTEEVRELIPDHVNLEWFWTDTYSNEDVERLQGGEVEMEDGATVYIPSFSEKAMDIYGFNEFKDDPSISIDRFIEDIETGLSYKRGKYADEFVRIYNQLKGETSTLSADNIHVLGVVVTGKAAELTALEELGIIRASVLGVTVDPIK
jgi:hypothetical protein